MKRKVLVVEDEQDTADLLKRTLEREGFSVLQAKDGRQASTLIENARPTSLVLLDLVLPYVSGSELLKLIRRHPDWQQTPVIVLSADHYEPDIERTLRDGATAYVTKQKGTYGLIEAMRRTLSTAPAPSRTGTKSATPAVRKRSSSTHRRTRGNWGKKRAA